MFEPWMLAGMEDDGLLDTSRSLNMRVARYLAENGSDDIGDDEFREACIACNVDPDSITSSDLIEIQNKLNELT